MNPSDKFKNILIIKPGAIGDLLQLTPVLRALKRQYPSAKISLLVGSSSTAELFHYNKNVSETIVYDKKNLHRTLWAFIGLWQELYRKQYDLVVNFQRSNLKTWLLAAAAFPCRVLVYHKARSRNVHAVVNYLETLAPLGIDGQDVNLELNPGPEARAFAQTILVSLGEAGKPVIALNPGASHPVNRWGTDRFAALADRISQELSAKVIIIGGAEDRLLAEEIRTKARSRPLAMTGKASILEAGALLEKCRLLVSGDTGPLHLAAAVGTPVLALFGAADPARTGPVGSGHRVMQAEGVACVPCKSRSCKNRIERECMEKISVDSVFEAVRAMIKKS